MGKIVELTPEIYNRIAAGEVIENPASVVKELVENSLDAQSSEIKVIIKQAGKKEITVIDNGEGMSEDDLELAIKKHATSKIKTIEDIDQIQTLGFRGEALSSIVSVSQMEISSKQKEDESGLKLTLQDNGKQIKKNKVSMNTGTTIKIQNLFYQTPARLKFLKSDNKELLNIKEALQKIIIPYYQVGFEIIIDNEKPLIYKAKKEMVQRLEDIYGHEITKELIPFKSENSMFTFNGYISKPSYNKSNKNYQFLFLHNRAIFTKYFHYWISLSYENLLMKDRFPVVFIFLEAKPGMVDVNVHPAKKEVRFSNEYALGNTLINILKHTLNENLLIPEVQKESDEKQGREKQNLAHEMKTKIDNAIDSFIYRHRDNNKIEVSLPSVRGIEEKSIENFFSLFNTYIFYEDQEHKEIFIIDQHAAHERVIYERLKRDLPKKENSQQNLLIPIHTHLSDMEFQMVMDNRQLFQEIGYHLEHFGGKTIIINGVPSYLRHQDDRKLFLDIVSDLLENKIINKENIKEEILKTIACKSAIKAGDRISKEQKESLIKDLLMIESRYTCPHGRPAVIKLSLNEIEKWFKRK